MMEQTREVRALSLEETPQQTPEPQLCGQTCGFGGIHHEAV